LEDFLEDFLDFGDSSIGSGGALHALIKPSLNNKRHAKHFANLRLIVIP
jgi:hypothetical protein